MEVFTHDIKKIKSTANKNGLKNATCKQSLTGFTQCSDETIDAVAAKSVVQIIARRIVHTWTRCTFIYV